MEGECSGLTDTTVFQRLFGRPPRRFCCAPDDVDLCRDLTNLRGARIVRFCDFTADDFRDLVLFAPRARNDRPPFRDLVWEPLNGGRLSAPFEVARLTAFSTGRPFRPQTQSAADEERSEDHDEDRPSQEGRKCDNQ